MLNGNTSPPLSDQLELDLTTDSQRKIFQKISTIILLFGLYLTTLQSYLLFHSLAEIFSIVVAFSLFVIAWNSRTYHKNPYLLFIGIAYFFIGFLDLLHTLSYKGMPIFTDYDFYANQLWIAARYLESLSLLAGFMFLRARKQFNIWLQFIIYSLITSALVYFIFVSKLFPECFIEGTGLTNFKKVSEYIISALLLGSIILLRLNRARFAPTVFSLLQWALICTIISELAFTFYISNYGFSNLVGHYFKIFSFYLVYKAIIQTGIKEPMSMFFFELKKS